MSKNTQIANKPLVKEAIAASVFTVLLGLLIFIPSWKWKGLFFVLLVGLVLYLWYKIRARYLTYSFFCWSLISVLFAAPDWIVEVASSFSEFAGWGRFQSSSIDPLASYIILIALAIGAIASLFFHFVDNYKGQFPSFLQFSFIAVNHWHSEAGSASDVPKENPDESKRLSLEQVPTTTADSQAETLLSDIVSLKARGENHLVGLRVSELIVLVEDDTKIISPKQEADAYTEIAQHEYAIQQESQAKGGSFDLTKFHYYWVKADKANRASKKLGMTKDNEDD